MRDRFLKFAAALTLGTIPLLAGCTSVPAYEQQHVSKTGMLFSDSLIGNNAPSLTAQTEPGTQTSGGAQGSGCSACR
ncbi:hypothetical protein [Pelagicoccus albus]|uniref:DUF4266 domain-containing protein n=1 Tax=Pelagicoccus albus TaxID=415222 RepID=A0A7X1B592_9BACT|nr:hypothetical protein [Pelagicoccus albus]MBC2604798.1 hypothetical protein [Pelagicoccus albus]